MKKLLLVLVIGASFAACNNNADSKPATDSPAAAAIDTSAKMGADTTKKVDTSAMSPMKDTSAPKK